MSAPSTRVMLYANDPGKTCAFYERHFGFVSSAEDQGVIELHHPRGGLILLVHRAAVSLKGNQARVKLVFDVENLEAFRSRALSNGLEFGPIHQGEGYGFANSKGPDGNGVSISSRAFRSR
ncbi:VOC family protein [Pseudomonas sp. MM211]|uniref:VOC family protein n=1 Tax=Pseudomonas sp. MM211 TaxID=2866808 RepID=UPI001CECAF43|nr:VOC family protein [Pseudomonas sp. MM211]UCJ14659.1 VOC family protein [Pseudomonas sp. MM211]